MPRSIYVPSGTSPIACDTGVWSRCAALRAATANLTPMCIAHEPHSFLRRPQMPTTYLYNPSTNQSITFSGVKITVLK